MRTTGGDDVEQEASAGAPEATAPARGRVLVVDDHRTFAELLERALRAQDGVECVGHACDVAGAMAMVEALGPDTVLMDVQVGRDDGVAATAELVQRHPGLRVVVLTAFVERRIVLGAQEAGACALVAKDGSLEELLRVLGVARAGSFLLGAGVRPRPDPEPGPVRGRAPVLTRREHDVLLMLAAGLQADAIARELGISLLTCRGYLKSLLGKLGAHTQLEAVVVAVRSGIIRVGEAG